MYNVCIYIHIYTHIYIYIYILHHYELLGIKNEQGIISLYDKGQERVRSWLTISVEGLSHSLVSQSFRSIYPPGHEIWDLVLIAGEYSGNIHLHILCTVYIHKYFISFSFYTNCSQTSYSFLVFIIQTSNHFN